MKKKNHIMITAIAVIILSTSLIPQPVSADENIGPSTVNINKMGILPFIKGRYGSTVEETLNTPVSNYFYSSKNISEEAGRILTNIVYEEMRAKYDINLISLLDAIIVFDRIDKKDDDTIITLAQKAGEILKVDKMIAGYVWRYKRRIGSSLAASSPASVGFSICVIDVSTGKLTWKDSFEESQKALSDNILEAKGFFKKGAKWLTAEDLARYGVKEILRKKPIFN